MRSVLIKAHYEPALVMEEKPITLASYIKEEKPLIAFRTSKERLANLEVPSILKSQLDKNTKRFLHYIIHACIYTLDNVRRTTITYIPSNPKFEVFCDDYGLNFVRVISWLFNGYNPRHTPKNFSIPCNKQKRELKAKVTYACYKNGGEIPKNLKWREIDEFIRYIDRTLIPFLAKFTNIEIEPERTIELTTKDFERHSISVVCTPNLFVDRNAMLIEFEESRKTDISKRLFYETTTNKAYCFSMLSNQLLEYTF